VGVSEQPREGDLDRRERRQTSEQTDETAKTKTADDVVCNTNSFSKVKSAKAR
jgi:hypothetical protein